MGVNIWGKMHAKIKWHKQAQTFGEQGGGGVSGCARGGQAVGAGHFGARCACTRNSSEKMRKRR